MYTGSQPVNLAILAAYLRKFNHEVKIIDTASGGNPKAEIEWYNPEVIGITGTTPVARQTYIWADYFKAKGYKVVIGGAHATALPEEAIKHADAVVVGEGELALLKIINENLTGIIIGEPLTDLDEIPIPSYDLLNMEFYLATNRFDKILVYSEEERVGNILISRGCPHRCTFCHNSNKRTKYRFNSPERVIQEITYLIENYAINALFFIEDNFFVNKERVKNICNLMIERNIILPWGANARVNNVDKELFKLAKLAGCRQITFGWESGSQRILDIYKKDVTVEQNVNSIKVCNELDILANGTLMIGGPTETVENLL